MATPSPLSAHDGRSVVTTFTNPVIWEDLPDMEVIRVGDVYYMSASSFAFSPGAPILSSKNLVDWVYIGHSVPELTFGERFYLDGQHHGAYGKGIWASTFRYRPSNGVFYWYGAIQGTEKTVVYSAKDPSETWTQVGSIDKFYYDAGLLFDDDDIPYLAYGTKTIYVAELTADGLEEKISKAVYTSDEYLEGARMYKIQGAYYIWLTRPYAGQYVLKSSSGPFGPYESRQVIGQILSPIPGSGCPHQGALVDTPEGNWYYMAFMDGFPGGRIPLLAPVTFNNEGWPEVEHDSSHDPATWRLEYPRVNAAHAIEGPNTCFRTHSFQHDELDHCWEWNHNPVNSKWNVQDGHLVLGTGTVTESLHLAANTLTHRVIGPKSMATFRVNVSGLVDGDRAGVCMFRNLSAYIGVHRDADTFRLVYVDDIGISPINMVTGWMNGHPVALDWSVDSNGSVRAETPLLHNEVWLRVKADVTPAFSHGYEKETRYAIFEYSYDGAVFHQLGTEFAISNSALGFVGYRFAVFNFATVALGGRLLVKHCDVSPFE